jgi:polysaccharide pyruvyl transferase CsaB
MTRPARILVSGYYGFANAGDEAILAGLLQGYKELAPEAELTVLSGDPEATACEHAVAAVPRDPRTAFSKLGESDLFISGGGGLLQDATSWRSPLHYLGLMRLARRAGLPVACLAHSIGPLRRRWVRWFTRRTLNRVDLLTVRDGLSETALRALGVDHEVHVTADLAFILPSPREEEIAAAWANADLARDDRPIVALALRQPPGDASPGPLPALASAVTAACQETALRPILIPMQYPRDVEYAEQVAARVSVPTEILRPHLAAREILAFIAGCDLVVAMRLHALIFGAICGRPLVAISYDPKVVGLMGELGLPTAASTENLAPEPFAGAIVAAWKAGGAISAALAVRVPPLRTAALRNVGLALALLRGGR